MNVEKTADRTWRITGPIHEAEITWSKRAYAWVVTLKGSERAEAMKLRADSVELAFDAVWDFMITGEFNSVGGARWHERKPVEGGV